MTPSRLLVVGNGSIAQRHVNNLRLIDPQAEIAAVPSLHRTTVTPRITGADITLANLEDALRWRPSAAVIATPASTHALDGIPLAEAGINLLVEKPIDTSTERAHNLIQMCERSGSVLLVGYCLRFSELAAVFRSVLLDETIGRILGARAEVGQHLADWRPGRDYRSTVSADPALGGGAVWELSHEIDLVTWLLGSASLHASHSRCTGVLDSDAEDLVEILLVHKTGEVSSIHLDLLQRPARRRLRVFGTEGAAEWDLVAGQLIVTDTSGTRVLQGTEHPDRNQMYLNELGHFLQCASGACPTARDRLGGTARAGVVQRDQGCGAGTEQLMTTRTAFVFARGGSKGLPGKNLREVGGHPLVGRAVVAARAVSGIDRVIVSTDDDAIARVAKEYGAEVPFIRPSELAGDRTPERMAWRHALAELRAESTPTDVFVSVPPTAPLRTPGDIRDALELFLNGGSDVVVTGTPSRHHPAFNMVSRDPEGFVRLLIDEGAVARRQDATSTVDLTTVAYVAEPSFVDGPTDLLRGRVRLLEVPPERAVDVDTHLDLLLARALIEEFGDPLEKWL